MADQPSDMFGACVFEVFRSDEEAPFPQRVGTLYDAINAVHRLVAKSRGKAGGAAAQLRT